MTKRTDAERFAEMTEALRRGGQTSGWDGDPVELKVAERLASTDPVLPDPAFASALRAELLARVTGAGEVRYAPLETPFGRIFVAYRRNSVVSAGAARDAAAFERNVAQELGVTPIAEEALPERLQRGLLDHLAGRRRFRDVDLSHLRPFQRRVLEKTAEIPRGEVRPYGWVAREIGAPGATRAVGTALGHNPVPFIIPCHRVVRADGSLGEYSGGGPEVKVRLLTWEGVPAEVLERPAPYRGSRTTLIFCFPTCRAARRIELGNAVDFAAPEKALAAGYRPCRLCRPAEVAAAS